MKFLIIFLLFCALYPLTLISCEFRSDPVILTDEPGKFLQSQIEQDQSSFWGEMVPTKNSLIEFRNAIEQKIDINPISLLNSQAKSFEDGSNKENIYKILRKEAGRIRSINCIEGLLLARQTDRSLSLKTSMYDTPTEFLSYVLFKQGLLKIYFYTTDQPGVRGLGIFNSFLEAEIKEGWSLLFNLHNHNFFPSLKNSLGATVPSDQDVNAFRGNRSAFGLNLALITNGFHTIEVTSKDFDVLLVPSI